MGKIRILYKYILHFFHAKNTKGFGIHSPYLYRFTHNVIYEKNNFYAFQKIETLREHLKCDDRVVMLEDYGTGQNREAKVKNIAKSSLKHRRWAQLLFRIVHFTQADTVLELGTSLGLTTAYMASPSSNTQCITFEGSEQVARIARQNFEKLNINNIRIVVGNIDHTLEQQLSKMGKLDVVFFDANHREKPVLSYFSQCIQHIHSGSVFIFDDIHWSREMERAWSEIQKNEKVTATIDLFEIGIVFFNSNFPKKNFRMVLNLL